MAQIVNLASFVGTPGQELSAADANWTQIYQGGSGIGTISADGRVYQSLTTEATYVRSETPGSANQTLVSTIRQVEARASGNHAGLVARRQAAANTYITGVLRSETTGRQIRAYKVINGTATPIGGNIPVTTVNGSDYVLQLEVTGQSPNLRIVVKLDGTTHLDETIDDNRLDAAGQVGIRFGYGTSSSSETQGLHMANFSASDDTGGSTVPVAFSGSVSNQTGTEGTAFSLDLSTYFSGTETPFAYSVQSGTLPAGLSLNSSTGVISGTPTTAGVSSGIVIRATDATPDTADTNSFSITIDEAGAPPDETLPTLTGTVTFTLITQTSYTASWPAGSDNVAVTGYEYQIGSTAGAWTDAGNNLSAAITGRTAGTTETVYVRAYDAAGLRSTPAISGSVTLLAASTDGTITVGSALYPIKYSSASVLNESGLRATVLDATTLAQVLNTSGVVCNAGVITITDAALTIGGTYHLAVKTANGWTGFSDVVTAS